MTMTQPLTSVLPPPQPASPYAWLDLTQMKVNHVYQRPLNQLQVSNLVANWDPELCDAIAVSMNPNGVYSVWEGQHRREALLQMGQTHFWCRIASASSVAQQAARFVAANNGRKGVSPIDAHRAQVVAGDRRAVEINHAVTQLGLTITNDVTIPGAVAAIVSLQDVWDRGGQASVTAVLTVAQNTWGNAGFKDAYNKDVLKGLSTFVHLYPNANSTLLTNALAPINPASIIHKVKLKDTGSTTGAGRNGLFASIIRRYYNSAATAAGVRTLRMKKKP
jgi:hypothetical protein